MADFAAIAKQFVQYYYNSFDTNRASLAPLYVRHLAPSRKIVPLILQIPLAGPLHAYV